MKGSLLSRTLFSELIENVSRVYAWFFRTGIEGAQISFSSLQQSLDTSLHPLSLSH